MSILERKAEIINNYFYKDMGNISNRKIWNTLKDIHTHKDLNLFEAINKGVETHLKQKQQFL